MTSPHVTVMAASSPFGVVDARTVRIISAPTAVDRCLIIQALIDVLCFLFVAGTLTTSDVGVWKTTKRLKRYQLCFIEIIDFKTISMREQASYSHIT